MFISLLGVTFVVAVLTCFAVAAIFRRSLTRILQRTVSEEMADAWQKYLMFAIYVVGISGGVRVWDLEKYITPRVEETEVIVLNAERWTLEVYRTVIGTLQSLAWLLLIVFLFSLIAYVIVRRRESSAP
ncbi:MAG: hypothetical protein GF405_00025 [Candidatus Eisenbacteria bacterium]|nr:hypothetical protein [Candidatus Eisenbacteria bacterium]